MRLLAILLYARADVITGVSVSHIATPQALAVVFSVVVASCVASGPEETALDVNEDHIVGGTVSTGDPAVFQLKTVTSVAGGTSIGSCTATLVAPNVLVTAAHCIESATASTVAWVNNETTPATALPSASTGWRRVESFRKHPSYPQAFMNLGYDCAVLVLQDPVTGIAPKSYRRTPLGAAGLGQMARIVGYGNTNGTAGTGSGTKRELVTRIKEVRDGVLTIGSVGATSCQGDSGGPAFLSEGGVEVISGISSYGDIGCQRSGSYARTELCADFFDQFVQSSCTPDCTGKACGGDGCGGSCGACGSGASCDAGQCVPPPSNPPVTLCSESEPNNALDRTNGNAFCSDGTMRGTLSSSSDNDFFVLDVPPNSTYDIQVTSGGTNVRLTVIRDVGGTFKGWDGGAARRVRATTPTGGRYFVKIYATAMSTANEPYALQATVTPK